MYSAAFIFEAGVYDERYHALDALIEAAAHAIPGYLGVEWWKSPDGAIAHITPNQRMRHEEPIA